MGRGTSNPPPPRGITEPTITKRKTKKTKKTKKGKNK